MIFWAGIAAVEDDQAEVFADRLEALKVALLEAGQADEASVVTEAARRLRVLVTDNEDLEFKLQVADQREDELKAELLFYMGGEMDEEVLEEVEAEPVRGELDEEELEEEAAELEELRGAAVVEAGAA